MFSLQSESEYLIIFITTIIFDLYLKYYKGTMYFQKGYLGVNVLYIYIYAKQSYCVCSHYHCFILVIH